MTYEQIDTALEAMAEYQAICDSLPEELEEADCVAMRLATKFDLTVDEAEAMTAKFYDWYADALEPVEE